MKYNNIDINYIQVGTLSKTGYQGLSEAPIIYRSIR